MEYITLGTTSLQVSALALGCMSLTHQRRDEGIAAVLRAVELGINFFDNADIYTPPQRGQSEEILGQALKEGRIPRDEVVIASKCGIVFQGMVEAFDYKAYDLSPAYLKESCENSLKRMGLETIDLYQPHRIDYLTHPEETARALEDLIAEGKIRHVGVSNYSTDEIRALSAYTRVESLQTQFSLMHLEPLETGLTAICLEKKMNVLAYSPLHKAVLTGKKGLAHDDWRAQREAGMVAQLRPFADAYDVTPGQLALAWLMQLPGGVIPLVGTANPDHIAEAAAAVDLTLDRDDWYQAMVIARGRPMPWKQDPYVYIEQR